MGQLKFYLLIILEEAVVSFFANRQHGARKQEVQDDV